MIAPKHFHRNYFEIKHYLFQTIKVERLMQPNISNEIISTLNTNICNKDNEIILNDVEIKH